MSTISIMDGRPWARLLAPALVRTMRDPSAVLDASCRYQTSIAATWRANVAVA